MHVIVVDATTTSLVPRLLADELDLAVVNLPVADPELVHRAPLRRGPDPHRARRPPARRARTRVDASPTSADHELLLEPSGTAFRDELDREAAAAGVELRAKAEVDGLRLIATLAFQGFGAAIVPATAAPDVARGQLAPGARRRARPALGRPGPPLAGACSPPRPGPCARRSSTVVADAKGPAPTGVHPAA